MDNGTELDEYSAASILFSLKHAKLNEETATKLEAMKRGIREKAAASTPSSSLVNQKTVKRKVKMIGECSTSTTHQNAVTLKGCTPPDVPPFKAIRSIIDVDKCSTRYQKALTLTDVDSHQLRLSLNRDHALDIWLPMLKEGEDITKGIDVIVYDQGGNKYNMKFKVWGSFKMFVLTTRGWKEFYQHHQLRESDVVVVWMFRHKETQRLCFAIGCRRN